MKTRSFTVGSHLATVPFYGIAIPVGFLTTFRKQNHIDCLGGQGFIRKLFPGKGLVNVICGCCTRRAHSKLMAVGPEEFARLSQSWIASEKVRLALDEERCRREGAAADLKATCPYPENSDQYLAWHEGRKKPESAAPNESPSP